MNKILVTGVGGGVGQSIIKAFQGTSYEVVGVDSEELAVGLYSVPYAYKGFYANNPDFIDRLIEIGKKEKCSLLFPGHDIELLPISKNIELFTHEGIIPIISNNSVIETCDDKLSTFNFLTQNGFYAPQTKRIQDDIQGLHFPFVLKPQKGGARSKKTYIAHDFEEYQIFKLLVDPNNCVIQEYVEGDEYTCGSVSLEGKCNGVIIMRRILRDGDTYKAFVEKMPKLEEYLIAVLEKLKPFGACNIQLRMHNEIPYIFEINARCSGTTGARALAGFNEPKMIADFLLLNISPTYSIKEVSILRYWKELVVCNDTIIDLAKFGYIENKPTIL